MDTTSLEPLVDGFLSLSSITLGVQDEFDTVVEAITLQNESESFTKELDIRLPPGRGTREEFRPYVQLSVKDKLSIMLHHQEDRDGNDCTVLTLKLAEVLAESEIVGDTKKTYFNFGDTLKLAISFHSTSGGRKYVYEAPRFNSEILRKCPRYRLLVVGNSGVGKSSLIKKVFGVENVHVSDTQRGEADIEKEFPSTIYEPFILHDSLGFEAGETSNYDVVKNFILSRRAPKDPRDRLHAVWVCLAVPYAKGRFTEAGTEKLLRFRKDIMGDIPVIVALTQSDLLERSILLSLQREGHTFRSVLAAKPLVDPRRVAFLQKYCTEPLQKAAGDVPHMPVSTDRGFELEHTVTDLVQATVDAIEKYVATNPS